ncbi:unnamed protein product, partial [Amoebophrya sp. A120]|eukprot:GSA120T00025180001.1
MLQTNDGCCYSFFTVWFFSRFCGYLLMFACQMVWFLLILGFLLSFLFTQFLRMESDALLLTGPATSYRYFGHVRYDYDPALVKSNG